MTLKEAYSYSIDFLETNGIDEADFKALCLVCHLCRIKNSEYAFHINDEVEPNRLDKALLLLKDGEPLQYVLGKWDFYESEFYVGRGVLIPRPETEELVETAIAFSKNFDKPIIYDLCSGSGCIGISLARAIKGSKVYCVEKSEAAFEYLLKNSKSDNNVIAINDDINNDIDMPLADIIISNPPYIKREDLPKLQAEVQREPKEALDGGEDGLDFYRVINEKYSKRLNPNGVLLLEIGNEQGSDVKSVLSCFKDVKIKQDIYKNDRIVIAKALA